MDNISHNIKQLRNHFKLTQSQFAVKIGNKTHNIGAWEEGRGTPSYDILQKISNIFSIPLNELIEFELDESYFSEKPEIYYNPNSESAQELVRYLQTELSAKQKIIEKLLDILDKNDSNPPAK